MTDCEQPVTSIGADIAAICSIISGEVNEGSDVIVVVLVVTHSDGSLYSNMTS